MLSTPIRQNQQKEVFDEHGVTLHFIQPGKLVQNAFVESFEERTHSTIGDVTPMEFIHNHQDLSQATQESTSLPWCNKRRKVNYLSPAEFEQWASLVEEYVLLT